MYQVGYMPQGPLSIEEQKYDSLSPLHPEYDILSSGLRQCPENTVNSPMTHFLHALRCFWY
jgi:hypothetical protein